MLTSSARTRRGFSRVGIALATVFAIVNALGLAVFGGDLWRGIGQGYEQAQCFAAYEQRHVADVDGDPWAGYPIAPKSDKNPFDQFDNLIPGPPVASPPPPGQEFVASSIGCPGPSYYLSFQDAERLVLQGLTVQYVKGIAWAVAGVAAIAAITVCIWLGFCGLGWTVAGFAKD